jgi:hypothetical protein
VGEDGTVEYTPGPDYNGYDSIGFRVDDGSLTSDPAFAVIEVTPVNDAPTASDLEVDVLYQTATEIDLPADDVDGDELDFAVVAPPQHGDVTGTPSGTVTYTPDAGYVGPDSFTFEVDDGDLTSNVATVTIDVGSTVPGPPIDVSAIGGDLNARVRWEPPLSDGGSPITGYEVRVVETSATQTTPADELFAVVGGLLNDTEYTFQVRAQNINGFGPYSAASNVAQTRPSCDIDAFTDVDKDHPFCPEIKWMADNGIAFGYPDGSYRPLAQVTRQAMAGFIYRLAGSEDGPDPQCTTRPYPDVATTHNFCGEIAWLKAEGIGTGYSDGTFRPGIAISRQAMAAFLYRLTGSPRGADPTCTTDEFTDVPASHPFCGEIDWMVDEGIAEGFNDGSFRPNASITRQAMAAFIFRYNILAGFVD